MVEGMQPNGPSYWSKHYDHSMRRAPRSNFEDSYTEPKFSADSSSRSSTADLDYKKLSEEYANYQRGVAFESAVAEALRQNRHPLTATLSPTGNVDRPIKLAISAKYRFDKAGVLRQSADGELSPLARATFPARMAKSTATTVRDGNEPLTGSTRNPDAAHRTLDGGSSHAKVPAQTALPLSSQQKNSRPNETATEHGSPCGAKAVISSKKQPILAASAAAIAALSGAAVLSLGLADSTNRTDRRLAAAAVHASQLSRLHRINHDYLYNRDNGGLLISESPPLSGKVAA